MTFNEELEIDAALEEARTLPKEETQSQAKKTPKKSAIAKTAKDAVKNAQITKVQEFTEGMQQASAAYLKRGRSDGYKDAESYAAGKQIGFLEGATQATLQQAVDFIEQMDLVHEFNDEQTAESVSTFLQEVEAEETDPLDGLRSKLSAAKSTKAVSNRLRLL